MVSKLANKIEKNANVSGASVKTFFKEIYFSTLHRLFLLSLNKSNQQ